MRGIVSVLALLGATAPAWAGLYNLDESHVDVPPARLKDAVSQLRAAAQPRDVKTLDPLSLRARYLAQAARLEASERDGSLTTLDRVSLAACYIRLGRSRDAIKLLSPPRLSREEASHFMVQANLAAAYHREGELDQALLAQGKALLRWPEMFAGWTQEHLDFYRECEVAYRDLLRNRANEVAIRKRAPYGIDPIFKDFRLPRKGEAYEAGRLPPEQMKKLPAKAFGVTRQLLLWNPEDPRLYWLMAELLNANGYVDAAYDIMASIVDAHGRGLFTDELFEHRRVLHGSYRAARELRQPSKQGMLLSGLMAIPKPTLAPGAAGPAAYLASCAAAAVVGRLVEFGPPVKFDDAAPAVAAAQQLPFNWMHITAGFGFGFLVAMLLGFQWQEWKRRRTRQALADLPEVETDLPAANESSAAFQEQPTSVQPPGR